jgi:hypothetical protein
VILALALGIVDDVENLKLKGSKTKKSKAMDVDYMVGLLFFFLHWPLCPLQEFNIHINSVFFFFLCGRA